MCDLGKSFNKLMSHFHTNHRGVIVEKRDGGYVYKLHFYPTLEELDAAIDLSLTHLEHSVNRLKTNQ